MVCSIIGCTTNASIFHIAVWLGWSLWTRASEEASSWWRPRKPCWSIVDYCRHDCRGKVGWERIMPAEDLGGKGARNSRYSTLKLCCKMTCGVNSLVFISILPIAMLISVVYGDRQWRYFIFRDVEPFGVAVPSHESFCALESLTSTSASIPLATNATTRNATNRWEAG